MDLKEVIVAAASMPEGIRENEKTTPPDINISTMKAAVALCQKGEFDSVGFRRSFMIVLACGFKYIEELEEKAKLKQD